MISYTSEAAVIGKYVLTYFEAFLRKLWAAVESKPELWYAFWIKDYLAALRSGDESLRASVCTFVTPIVIKIHKMSLAYILSKFLQENKNIELKSVDSLASLMTLLKVARQNKMICICDDTKDIKKYISDPASEKSNDMMQLSAFLQRVISFCEESLYVDKPIETALPLFEILKMI